jgi:hypothetical protein
MSFATKLCHVVYADGSTHDVMKHPATDKGKISLPGNSQHHASYVTNCNTCNSLCQHHSFWLLHRPSALLQLP